MSRTSSQTDPATATADPTAARPAAAAPSDAAAPAKSPAETATSPPPSLVCFDLGGVVVRICRTWQEGCAAAGIPLRGMERRDATRQARGEAVLAYQTGLIDSGQFARRISAILEGDYSPEEILAVHRAWILGEYPGIAEVIDAIHAAGLETAALSNTNEAHWGQLEAYPAFLRIRHRHASHHFGLHKPDPAIYRAFEEAVGRRGQEILFFDDLPENVQAALALGWQAEQIDHAGDPAAQVRAALTRRGVPF